MQQSKLKGQPAALSFYKRALFGFLRDEWSKLNKTAARMKFRESRWACIILGGHNRAGPVCLLMSVSNANCPFNKPLNYRRKPPPCSRMQLAPSGGTRFILY